MDSLLGERDVGDNLRTTLNAKAQKAAVAALKGRKGAVVALDPVERRVARDGLHALL